MRSFWLNRQNNKNLIVFFAGWSFDNFPFVDINPTSYDVLIVYDYNDLVLPKDFEKFSQYENKTLISWSMGVFAAYELRDLFKDFNYKLILNGTVTPVDDEFGIPVKMFELTLKHAEKGLEGKFYKNVFLTDEEYGLYESYPVRRSIENRVSELENLYDLIKNKKGQEYEKFYDFAIVSEFDKIIPPKNQIASHKKNDIPFITVSSGHFIFYNFSSWDEIIRCRKTINI